MKSDTKRKNGHFVLGDFFPKYRISMLDNGKEKRIHVEGAKKLLLCLEKEVKIFMGMETVRVEGESLACVNYANGMIEISGKVRTIFFETRVGGEDRN